MDDDDLSVIAQRIRLLYRQAGVVLLANVVNGTLVAVALWGRTDPRSVIAWVSALGMVTILRGCLWLRYLTGARADNRMPAWGGYFAVGSSLSGIIWGSAALLFVSGDDPLALLLVTFVIGGMAAGAVTGLASHLPAFFLYVLLSTLPLEGRLLALGGRVNLAMAAMLATFIFAMAVIGRSYNRSLTRSLQLAAENRRLIAGMEDEVRERTAELQNTNDELQHARAEAEEANLAKSRFLAAASHDLRQPMQSMFLFCQTLRYHLRDQKGRDALVMLERGLDILKNLLDGLLDMSRLDVNVIEPQVTAFPAAPLLAEIAAYFTPIAASKGVRVAVVDCGSLWVRSDRNLLGRMIRNIVENAVRYTEAGTIELSAVAGSATARIDIRDTGIGMAPQELGRIFEEFHQIGNPERDKSRGLGLGLAIVKRLSAILRHPVEVHSEPGEGSTFSIIVPVQARAEEEIGAPDAEAPAMVRGAGKMVVVVDDEAMVLLGLRRLFEDWGYAVVIAGSADEAVDRLRLVAEKPFLVIADYRLRSGRVGTEAVIAIRALCGDDIPGIILTGETGADCAREAAAHRCRIVYKPVTPHQLAAALEPPEGEALAG